MLSESSPFTNILSAAQVDTDGSYVELISSTARAYKWMIVSILTNQTTLEGLLDIAVGSTVFLSDHLLYVHAATFPRKMSTTFYVPVTVAASSQIRARIQDTSSSAITWSIKVMFSDVTPPVGTPTKMDKSGKVIVTSSSSIDTYGSYVNLITSAAHAGKWLLIGVGQSQSLIGNNEVTFGIGVGNPPSGTDEIDEFGSIHSRDAGGGVAYMTKGMLVPCDFAEGDQLQIRVKMNKAEAIAMHFSINLLG